MRGIAAWLRGFCASRKGNVAVIFAVSLVPLMLAVGGGLDYARAAMVRAAMNEALDAAALALGASSSLTQSQAETLAQQYFSANYKLGSDYGTPGKLTVSIAKNTVTITASSEMPTTLMKVVGVDSWTVKTASTVVWGQTKIWVSLVLDNTGSMAQTDYSGVSKMSALKTASKQLLTMFQNVSQNAGDVRVAIIPFARNVKLGTSYSTSNWLSFSDFTAAPPVPSSNVGPNSTCPWKDSSVGYHCTTGSANGASATSKVPSSGLICPSQSTSGHYWNGCYNSVKTSKYSSTYTHTWTANATSTWTGCVADRGPSSGPSSDNYDVNVATPTDSDPATMMVAENSPSCPIASILPLSYDWNALTSKIDDMQSSGSTNQTIGLVWGWHALTQGAPLNPPSLPDNTSRIIIILSDGLNTQNRWSGDGSNQSSAVDNRMAMACANAKADGVIIYAVFVDLNGTQGNSSVLQNCATDSSRYFDLTTSSQIITAFTAIGQQITNLRVSQ